MVPDNNAATDPGLGCGSATEPLYFWRSSLPLGFPTKHLRFGVYNKTSRTCQSCVVLQLTI